MGSVSSPCRPKFVRKRSRSSFETSSEEEEVSPISTNIGQAVRAASLRRNHALGTDLDTFPVCSWRVEEEGSENPTAMEPFFSTVLENYVRTEGEAASEEVVQSWALVLDYLSECLSPDLFVPARLVHLLASKGLRDQNDSEVRSKVHSLMLEIVSLHPPLVGSPMCEVFMTGLFVRQRDNKMDPLEHFFFLTELIEACFLSGDAPASREDGLGLLFHLTVLALQHNFEDWTKKHRLPVLPMIFKLIWPGTDVSVNSCVMALTTAMARSWKSNSDMLLRRSLMTLIAMVAQMLAASDARNCNNSKKSDLALIIVRQFQAENDFLVNPTCCTAFARMACYLKPNWLSVMVSSTFLTIKNNLQQTPTLSRLLKCLGGQQTQGWLIVDETMKFGKRNKFGETELHRACKTGKLDKLRELLSAPDVEINVGDYNGWTALHEACFHGHTDCVRTLLQTNKVNILALGGEDGLTALHEALLEGRIKAFQAILDHVSQSSGQDKHFSVNEVVQFPSRTGKTVMELSDSAWRLVIENALAREVVNERKFTPTKVFDNRGTQLLAANCLGKYCSDSSLHIIMELIKPERSSQCHFVLDAPESQKRSFGLVRSEKTMAKDIRVYSSLLSKIAMEKQRIGSLVVLFHK